MDFEQIIKYGTPAAAVFVFFYQVFLQRKISHLITRKDLITHQKKITENTESLKVFFSQEKMKWEVLFKFYTKTSSIIHQLEIVIDEIFYATQNNNDKISDSLWKKEQGLKEELSEALYSSGIQFINQQSFQAIEKIVHFDFMRRKEFEEYARKTGDYESAYGEMRDYICMLSDYSNNLEKTRKLIIKNGENDLGQNKTTDNTT